MIDYSKLVWESGTTNDFFRSLTDQVLQDLGIEQEPHSQVEVDFQGNTISVDEEIAPLLQVMWDLGLQTYLSCQECEHSKFLGRPYAWISFASGKTMDTFYTLIQPYIPQEDRARVAGFPLSWIEAEPGFAKVTRKEGSWVQDMEVQLVHRNGEDHFEVGTRLFFPKEEIPKLTEILTEVLKTLEVDLEF